MNNEIEISSLTKFIAWILTVLLATTGVYLSLKQFNIDVDYWGTLGLIASARFGYVAIRGSA